MYHLIFIVKIKNNMKVCILGDGLTSLTLAKALVNKKIFVDLIVKKKNMSISKTRTIGISKSNVEFFNKNIFDIDKILWKIKKIEILSENLKRENLINFTNRSNSLFSIVRNFKLSQLLEKSLSKSKYFKKLNLKINENICQKYNLIINTDYNNSITKRYFSKKIVKNYNSKAFATIIKHEKISNDIATQTFTKKGPLAFLPISNTETSIVYSAKNVKYKKSEDIKDLIKTHNLRYRIKKIDKISAFELRAVFLRKYYHKNILAFGDLIHKIHPLAGQGFNMTIRDIKNLISLIDKRLILGLPIDQSINTEFENNLKDKNFIFSNGIDLIYEFFNIEENLNSSFLRKSIQNFGKNTFVNKIFTKIADRGIVF